MSENLDLVRSIYAAWERGDYSSAEWAHARMADGWRDWLRAWKNFRMAEVEKYLELDAERVLVLQRFTGRGKASDLEVAQTEATGACVFHVRDGKVTRLLIYPDRERALADLGLKE